MLERAHMWVGTNVLSICFSSQGLKAASPASTTHRQCCKKRRWVQDPMRMASSVFFSEFTVLSQHFQIML